MTTTGHGAAGHDAGSVGSESRDREARALELVAELLDRPTDEQRAAVDAACGDDEGLRARVLALLERDASTSDAFSDDAGWIGRELLDDLPGDGGALPERIGRFRILSRLGRGGMGVVYEAEQDKPRRRVAVKVLDPGLAGVGRARRFEREQEALARLQHPGIAMILETGRAATPRGELPWFAMELVDGSPITVHADRARLDVRRRLALLADLCDAVQHAHEHGVLHRDLKPDNVLVDGDGRVKVLDFGVARLSRPESVAQTLVTETGALLGTLAYMAPEQLDADVSRVGPASDVYALGVLAYELLCGRRPHEVAGLPIQAAARLIAERDAPRPGQHDTRLRGDIETVVLKALEKEPERRYGSAAMLGADLRRILAHEPIQARPPTLTYRFRRFSRRHRGLVAAVVTLAVGAAVSLALAVRSDRLADLAEERRQETLVESARAERLAYRSSLLAASAAVTRSEQGSRARLDEAPVGLRGWEWHHLRARLEPRSRWITDFGCPDWTLMTSREEPWVSTFEWSTGRVRVFDVRDGAEVDAHTVPGDILYDVAFVDGGRHLLSVATRPGHVMTFRVRDLEADVWTDVRHLPEDSLQWNTDGEMKVVLSRTGRWVAVTAMGGHTYLMDTRTGTIDVLSPELTGATWSTRGDFLGDTSLCFFAETDLLMDIETGRAALVPPSETGAPAVPLEGAVGFVRSVGTAADRSELLDASTGELVRFALLPPVTSPALAPGGDAVAAALLRTGEIAILDLPSGEVRAILGSGDENPTLEFAAGGDVLLMRGESGLVAWDRPLDDPARIVGHEGYVYDVELSPDAGLLASAAWDGTVRLWDTASGASVATWRLGAPDEINGAFVHGVRFGPAGDTAFAFGDAGVWALDLAHGRMRWESDRRTRFAALDPAGERLATAYAAQVHVLDARDGRLLASAQAPHDDASTAWYGFYPLLWSGDGRSVSASCGGGARIRTFDGFTLELIREIPADHGTTLARLGEDILYVAPGEGVRLVDASSGRVLRRYPHEHEVLALAPSPDGTRLVTGDRSGMVRIWDAEAGTELAQLAGHTDYVKDLAWTPDGRTLFSASGDGTIRVWDSWPLRERSRTLRVWHEVARRLRPEVARRFEADVAAGRTADVPIAERVADLGETDRERQIARQLLLGMRLGALGED